MKLLRRIKLINWHLFSHQTIEINKNSLVSGENGVGKSTFLDAIQYVLTGGRAKFNTAANMQAKRDLEGYIRCKLGMENKTYLRNGDVTSHIALEFYDNQKHTSLVIGVIIEINKSGRTYERFYHIDNCEINDSLFIEEKVILGYSSFKKNLTKQNRTFSFCDTKEKTRKLFLNVLEIYNEKYIELIPKALAFRPIDELNKFVFTFLLNEKNVSIEDLRQNVQCYRELEKLLETLYNKEKALDDIDKNYENYEKEKERKKILGDLQGYCKQKELELEKQRLRASIENINTELQRSIQEREKLTFTLHSLQDEIDSLNIVLNKNNSYQYYHELERRLNLCETKKQQLIKSINDLRLMINNENNLAKYIYQNYKNETILNTNLNIDDDYELLISNINKIKLAYETFSDDIIIKLSEFKKEKQTLEIKLTEINDEISHLERNHMTLPLTVMRLKELIETELQKLFNQKIRIFAFCELVDIKDDAWRNAIEGYLNTQKFDLIVEPEYFDVALAVYEKHKLKEKLFGVGLVNTNKLDIYTETNEVSLSARLFYKNKYAKLYGNMLLNQVVCSDDINDLKKHRIAITKTGMVYKNFTARQIDSALFQKPYIGINALKYQLNANYETKKELINKIQIVNKNLNQNEFILERIKNNQLGFLSQKAGLVVELKAVNKEIDDLRQKLMNFKINDVINEIQITLNEKKATYKNYEIQRNDCLLSEGKLVSNLENKKEQLNVLEERSKSVENDYDLLIVNYYQDLMKQYQGNINKVFKYCDSELNETEKLMRQLSETIILKMNQFNLKYHMGYSPTIEAISDYLEELRKIRDYDLIKYQEEARNARINCEIAFREQFIYQLRENINHAEKELNHLNLALRDKRFGGDEYEFIYKPSNNPEYERYYHLIMNSDDYLGSSLFQETLNDQNKIILKELFEKLLIDRSDKEAQETLTAFCDYRNYMSYDIKIHHRNGEVTYFSKVNREKSGGETQTPFYVVIAASFEQLLTNNKKEASPACFVMFDEAFNNMDESRIKAMMEFYQQLNIQLMIAVPPQRIETIIPHVNTTLVVIKDEEQSYIESFTYQNDISKFLATE